MGIRCLSREAALTALRLTEELHTGARELPPEIVEQKKRIEAAKRNAALFMVRVGAVDEGMINYAVGLMLELDRLYAQWAESETPSLSLH